MASSGPVGRMPTFRPRSDVRGRALGVAFWAAVNAAVSTKTVTMAKNLLLMGIVYGQNVFENGKHSEFSRARILRLESERDF